MRRSVSMSSTIAATLFFSVFFLLLCAHLPAEADDVRRISKEDLKLRLDDPKTIIIDVRQESAWRESDEKIKGAVRENPIKDEKSWAGKYPKDRNIVLYCS